MIEEFLETARFDLSFFGLLVTWKRSPKIDTKIGVENCLMILNAECQLQKKVWQMKWGIRLKLLLCFWFFLGSGI